MSQKIIQFMIDNAIISAKDRDIYAYGLDYIIEYISFTCIALFIGMFFHFPIPMLIFLFTFFCMRLYGGGYHASKHIKCVVYSYITIIIFCFIITIEINFLNSLWNYFINTIYILSYILYNFLTPVDTPNKRFNKEEYKIHRIKSIILNHIIAIIYIFLLYNKINILCTAISIGCVVSTLSLIVGRRCNES